MKDREMFGALMGAVFSLINTLASSSQFVTGLFMAIIGSVTGFVTTELLQHLKRKIVQWHGARSSRRTGKSNERKQVSPENNI